METDLYKQLYIIIVYLYFQVQYVYISISFFFKRRQKMLWLVRNPRLMLVQENNPMKEYF